MESSSRKPSPNALQVELGHLLEVGHPEPAAEVDHLERLAGESAASRRYLEDVAAVLEERLDLEDLGRGVDVDAAQDQLRMRQGILHSLLELGLVHAELAYRPAHAHLRAHELGRGIDAESNPDRSSPTCGYLRETLDLAQRLDVVGEDALLDDPLQLVVGLAWAGEDDVFGLEASGPRHGELAGGGNLCASRLLAGYELAHPEARVRLDRVGDLSAQSVSDAADPLYDRLPVVEVEGSAVLSRYLGDGYARGGELPVALPAETLRQVEALSVCVSIADSLAVDLA